MKVKRALALLFVLLATSLFVLLGSAIATEASAARTMTTCPATGDWVKIEPLSGPSYTYTAPEGMLVSETCYKHSTFVHYGIVTPPAGSVTITADSHLVCSPWWNCHWHQYDLSHASFRLEPVPTTPPPVTTEPPPVTTEPPPVTTEAPPVTTEPPPVTTEAPPTEETPETPTPPPPTKPACVEQPLYYLFTLEMPSRTCYLISYDRNDRGGFWIPSVESQLRNCCEVASNAPYGGWVTKNSCSGETHYRGQPWVTPDPNIPAIGGARCMGGGGGDCP